MHTVVKDNGTENNISSQEFTVVPRLHVLFVTLQCDGHL